MKPRHYPGWKAVDRYTGEEIKFPCRRKNFRGDEVLVTGLIPPRSPNSEGRILVRERMFGDFPYFPSVVDLRLTYSEEQTKARLGADHD